MHPTKAPGPDGMSAVFFQKYWDIVGGDVTKMIQNVFCSGLLPRDINKFYVVLIPKVQGVLEFKHLKPISLCNTIYKILSKILAGRIRPLLKKIISPNQSAFYAQTLDWWECHFSEWSFTFHEDQKRFARSFWHQSRHEEGLWLSKLGGDV